MDRGVKTVTGKQLFHLAGVSPDFRSS